MSTTTPPTVQEVLASYQSGSYRKYDDAHNVLDWSGARVSTGSLVEWFDADGHLVSGVVRAITDLPGALWDGSTDAALTIDRTPDHVAICSARSVCVVAPHVDRWETSPGLDIHLARPRSQQPTGQRCEEVDRRAHRRQASKR